MPDRLSLPEDWLIENMRSAVESYRHLNANSEQVVSEQKLDSLVELAAVGLSRNVGVTSA